MLEFRKLSLSPSVIKAVSKGGIIKKKDLQVVLDEEEQAGYFLRETVAKCEALINEAECKAHEIIMHAKEDAERRSSVLEKKLINDFTGAIDALHSKQKSLRHELEELYIDFTKNIIATILDDFALREKTEIILYQFVKYLPTLNSGVFICNPVQKEFVKAWLDKNNYTFLVVEIDPEQDCNDFHFVSGDAKYSINWNSFVAVFQ